MTDYLFIRIKSSREDSKLINNETGDEYTEEEAIQIVRDCWSDMPADYFSWDLEKVIFKSTIGDD